MLTKCTDNNNLTDNTHYDFFQWQQIIAHNPTENDVKKVMQ